MAGWTTEASDTTARYQLAAAYDSSANLTYAIDGYSGTQGLATVTAYSHASDAWTAEASDTTARYYLAAAYDSSANLTYAIDGTSGSGVIATVTAYSHASDAWTAEASDTTARYGLAAAYDSSANLTYAIDGYSGTQCLATVTAYQSATAPAAPTLISPANASYLDASSGVAFVSQYNSTDGASQNAYALEIMLSTASSFSYWNATSGTLQSTIVWNAVSTAPNAQWSVTLPSTAVANGNTYNWSTASQESIANLQGPFATNFVLNAAAAPTLTVTAPSGTIPAVQPLVSYTATPGSGSVITNYEIIVETGTFGTTPGSGTQVWTSGLQTGNPLEVQIGVPLINGTSYRAFVQVTETGSVTSGWGFITWTESFDPPAEPTIVATATADPVTECPMIQLVLQGHDNLVSTVDGSFETGVGTATIGTVTLPTPTAPTVTVEGTAGTTGYSYQVAVTYDAPSYLSATGSTTTGNATLSTTDYNLVSWDAVPLPAGSPGNLVYDSNLANAIASVGPTWDTSASTIGTANGDMNVLNPGLDTAEIVYYGTGASASPDWLSEVFDVTPGATYTLSALIDATNATAGAGPTVYLVNADNTAHAGPSISQTLGASGTVSDTTTVSGGYSQVRLVVGVTNGTTVTAGDTVSWSQIQLTETSTVQPYEPGPLPTYTVYGRGGIVGATTALAYEDTGAPVSSDPLAQSLSEALDGSYSLSLQASTVGPMSVTQGPYSVIGGDPYVWMAWYRAEERAEQVRTDIAWYDGPTPLSTTQGTVVSDTSTNWSGSVTDGTAPSTATQAYLVHNVLDAVGPLSAPSAPTVTPEGTAGTTTYDYAVNVENAYGSTPASATGSTTTGNATLSTTDYNLVSWDAVPLPAGSPGNLVYDSNLTNAIASVGPTWNTTLVPIGTANGDFDVLNGGSNSAQFVYYGTGAATNPGYYVHTLSMVVVPGATYALSALIDASAVTAGSPYIGIWNPTITTEYLQVSQAAGVTSVLSGTWTVPSGVTEVILICHPAGCTVTAASLLSWSQIQLTETSTVQPYEPGPLPTYNVYGRSGTLGLLGSTTALAYEDTGAATPGAASPTTNTTGEVHYIDEVGVMPGAAMGDILTALSLAPVADWELSDPVGSLTAAELVGGATDPAAGTVHGGVTFGAPGPVTAFPLETAATFDGSTGYISAPGGDPTTPDFTLAAWFQREGTQAGNSRLVMDGDNLNAGAEILLAAGIYPALYVGGTGPQSATAIEDSNWHLMVGTAVGTAAAVYIDGAVVASGTCPAPLVPSNNLNIGRGNYGSDYFSGQIAKVRIFDYALTAAQVAAMYNADLATGSLVEKWTRGGLVGTTTAAILRSDGLYVRNASLANPLTIPNPSQQVTVNDYEAVPTVSYTYTGSVSSVSQSVTSPQGPVSDAVTLTTVKWWELDPTDPSTAIAAQMIQWEPQNTEQSAAHQVLGQTTMNIIASAMMHQDFSAQAELFDPNTYDGFQALLVSQKVLWISSPWGKTDTGYFRIGPETGGMSTGYGNKAKDTQLLPSTSAGPHRTVSITAVAQPRPTV